MNTFILVVILVVNGRSYHEEPIYAKEFPSQAACQAVAATYPTSGFNYQKAVCVPKLSELPKVQK